MQDMIFRKLVSTSKPLVHSLRRIMPKDLHHLR